MIHYGMTKTAQLAISRGLAETTAGTGVTVNTVLPGPTASEGANEFVDHLAASSKQTKAEFEAEFFRSVRPSSLLRRFARPEEVAPLVAFLCSPLSWRRMALPSQPMAVSYARSSEWLGPEYSRPYPPSASKQEPPWALISGSVGASPRRTAEGGCPYEVPCPRASASFISTGCRSCSFTRNICRGCSFIIRARKTSGSCAIRVL